MKPFHDDEVHNQPGQNESAQQFPLHTSQVTDTLSYTKNFPAENEFYGYILDILWWWHLQGHVVETH